MKILYLSTWFPYPLDSGARIRIHHLLRELAEHHTLDVVAYLPDEYGEPYLPTLRRMCRRVEAVRANPFWVDPVKARRARFSLTPTDLVAGHNAEYDAITARLAQNADYDVIIGSNIQVEQYALRFPYAARVIEEHNFITTWLEEFYRKEKAPHKKLARWVGWQKCRRYERWLFPQFNLVSMVSERDRQAVERNIPAVAGRVRVIPNGVDLERNCPSPIPPQPGTLVFNGALSYYANYNAMQFFLGEVFPRIRAERPGVSLKITGRTDRVNLAGLPLGEGVTLTGFLDDVRPTVTGSWACVAPLLEGGGSRLKILEAMALGVPVVATSKGAEGLDVRPDQHLLIADDAETFAHQCLRLLGDPALHAALAQAGRALVEEKYGWESIRRSFCALVEEVAHAHRP